MARGSRRPQRGADLHHGDAGDVRGVAFAACQRAMTVTRRENCRACAGSGATRSSTGPCHVCQGTGAVRSVRGHMVFSRSCARVRRNGPAAAPCVRAVRGKRTGNADRDGARPASRQASPTAIGSACRARATPASAAVLPAISYVTVQVAPHPVFRREGDDLHMTVTVAVHEAALGARVDDPHARRARRACACRRGRSRASVSVCASAARRRRGTECAAI